MLPGTRHPVCLLIYWGRTRLGGNRLYGFMSSSFIVANQIFAPLRLRAFAFFMSRGAKGKRKDAKGARGGWLDC